MSNPLQMPAYHIFCDEYGDQSLKQKASEFFIYSAVIVSAKHEPRIPEWVRRINRRRRAWQGQPLHFTELDERTKLWGTRFIGKLPIRCFALISHKENMREHRNIRAEKASDVYIYDDGGTPSEILPRRRLYYSQFVLKVLLERATSWCGRRCLMEFGEARPVTITIAQRGGFYIDRFKSYLFEKDRQHWLTNSGTLRRYLDWRVVELDRINTAPANDIAGLQLSDVVTGAFSRAIDENRFGECDLRFVSNLSPRIALKGATAADFGVTGLPWKLWEANYSSKQEKLFRMFGYNDETLVRPGSILPT